ncbi:MAG: pyridoxal phosphate-dependent aminotransferase [Spirochaetales bacterium]|jgi:aspartate/methionine/tyrosine aminotransferase|nr:pyridoxal phosphate-dependent aminotransferase [Spirochaetales bacterium]
MKESKRILGIQSPIIPVIGEMIRENPGTISLGQGVVNYGPPKSALDGIGKFLSNPDNHRYQMVQGIPVLLDLINKKLERENRISVEDRRRVVVTAGGNMAFINAVLTIADPGDEIILLLPYYFNHEMAIGIAGAVPICVPTDVNYQPRLDAIEAAITEKTRGVVTISPNNPTGAVYSEESIRGINKICLEHGIYHIHDEAYEYFTYDNAVHYSPGSAAESRGHTISLFSLSKAYGFASWRIGWMVIPENLFDGVRKIQDTNLICPPVISQWAAAGALEAGHGFYSEKISLLADVRRMVLDKLSVLSGSAEVSDARGAFYFLLSVNTKKPDIELVERLIQDHGVAVIPGSAFGIENGCYLRIAYGALGKETLSDGIDRLVSGLIKNTS